MASTPTERTRTFRKQRADGSEVQINVWIPSAEAARLAMLARRDCSSKRAVIVKLLREAK
jgi:hypothetical protein